MQLAVNTIHSWHRRYDNMGNDYVMTVTSLFGMPFTARNARYLRVSAHTVLLLYIYLDDKHVEWMTDRTNSLCFPLGAGSDALF